MSPLLKIILVAALTSYGLSLAFWLGLGVFQLPGFIFVSAAVAAAGALIGWLMKRSLLVTVIATAAIRVAAFLIMTQGGG